ncbi:MAG: ribonuclease HIII [Bacilli bacterium]|nr:ribonuclease HIII [Bacilli bacterium]
MKAKSKTIVYKLSDNTKEEIIKYYADKKRPKTPPYAVFQADEADTVITLYESGKVMFQGIGADIDAAMWKERETHLNHGKPVIDLTKDKKKDKIKEKDNITKETSHYYHINSIGSDEVGTGDYFGPIIVTAAFVTKKDIPFLEDLKIKDSKNILDEKIIEIAPQLIKKIPHAIIMLNNKDYNLNYSKKVNMNKIKAILHNKAITNLLKDNNYQYEQIIVDQFVNKNKYYEYLKDTPNFIKNINFVTKAESKYFSVACAAIISRYLFLKETKKISDKLNIIIPKGAGSKVDEAGKIIVEKYGEEKLKEIAKLNFKNTTKILNKNDT